MSKHRGKASPSRDRSTTLSRLLQLPYRFRVKGRRPKNASAILKPHEIPLTPGNGLDEDEPL